MLEARAQEQQKKLQLQQQECEVRPWMLIALCVCLHVGHKHVLLRVKYVATRASVTTDALFRVLLCFKYAIKLQSVVSRT